MVQVSENRKAVVKLTICSGDPVAEATNLYRWSGDRHSSGWCSGVESFVKDRGTRDIIGRWMPCPNASVNITLQRHLGQAA